MSISCTVCGFWYPHVGPDRLDICPECYLANFAGSQPPLDPWAPHDPPTPAPGAREALEAFVDAQGPYQLTPRQVEAMRRMAAHWQQEADAAC